MTPDLTVIAAFRASDADQEYFNSLLKLAERDAVEIVCVTDDVSVFGHFHVDIRHFSVTQDDGTGIYSAFNLGVSSAKGKYYSFYNAGDYIELGHLPALLATLREDTSDVLFFGGYYGSHKNAERYKYTTNTLALEQRFFHSMPNVHGAIFFKRASCAMYRFNLDYKTAADLLQLNEIFTNEKCTFRVIDLDWYTLKSGGVSSQILVPSIEKTRLYKELGISPVMSFLLITRSIVIKLLTRFMGDYWYVLRRLIR